GEHREGEEEQHLDDDEQHHQLDDGHHHPDDDEQHHQLDDEHHDVDHDLHDRVGGRGVPRVRHHRSRRHLWSDSHRRQRGHQEPHLPRPQHRGRPLPYPPASRSASLPPPLP